MKRVLWISRHILTKEQCAGLERFCGGEIAVHCWQNNVENIDDLLPEIAVADVIAAVLPIHLLAGLVEVAGERPVLIPVANRTLVSVPEGESEVRFAHNSWQRIIKFELRMEPADKD